eukprot:551519-Rhodomonas_salina.1
MLDPSSCPPFSAVIGYNRGSNDATTANSMATGIGYAAALRNHMQETLCAVQRIVLRLWVLVSEFRVFQTGGISSWKIPCRTRGQSRAPKSKPKNTLPSPKCARSRRHCL